MNEKILSLILDWGPTVITILTMLGIVLRVLAEMHDLHKQVTDMKSVKDLNEKMSQVIQENIELKKKINELLMKIDHVQRK